MWGLVLALGGLLTVATAQGPEFDLQKFKETYVRDGAICQLDPALLRFVLPRCLGVSVSHGDVLRVLSQGSRIRETTRSMILRTRSARPPRRPSIAC